MQLTDKEKELIEVIRLYKRSYPNGKKELLRYATQLFEELTDMK